MILFDNAGKAFRNRKGEISWILRNISETFPSDENVGILAPSGQGKSTLINLTAGNELPSEGRVLRHTRVSWPYSFRGNVSNKLTGRQNLRFLCDVYGRNFTDAYDFVAEFSDLGRYLDMSLKSYSNEMKWRLSISALFAMNFDCILVDDSMDGGDASFRRRCGQHIAENKDRLSFFIATSNPALVSKYCQTAGVLNDGKLTMYASIDEATAAFNQVNMVFI
jgi:capsular polysaccharide transport system ATP-binding protein